MHRVTLLIVITHQPLSLIHIFGARRYWVHFGNVNKVNALSDGIVELCVGVGSLFCSPNVIVPSPSVLTSSELWGIR